MHFGSSLLFLNDFGKSSDDEDDDEEDVVEHGDTSGGRFIHCSFRFESVLLPRLPCSGLRSTNRRDDFEDEDDGEFHSTPGEDWNDCQSPVLLLSLSNVSSSFLGRRLRLFLVIVSIDDGIELDILRILGDAELHLADLGDIISNEDLLLVSIDARFVRAGLSIVDLWLLLLSVVT